MTWTTEAFWCQCSLIIYCRLTNSRDSCLLNVLLVLQVLWQWKWTRRHPPDILWGEEATDSGQHGPDLLPIHQTNWTGWHGRSIRSLSDLSRHQRFITSTTAWHHQDIREKLDCDLEVKVVKNSQNVGGASNGGRLRGGIEASTGQTA